MYSLSYLGITIILQTTVKWYQYYYAPPDSNFGGMPLLIPLGLIGFAMVFARIFDGAANPIVAYYSDKCRSAMGRRKPFILFGSLPLITTFILLWFPPVQGRSTWNFVYLSLMLCLFFTFFTIVVDPYLALIGDISQSKEERIRLTTMQGVAQIIGVLIAEAGSALIIKTSGFRAMGLSLGIVAFITLILTPLFVKELPVEESERRDAGFLNSIGKTLGNRNFLFYLISYLALWCGINTLTIAMPYITEILLETRAENSGFYIGATFIVAALFSPALPAITLRFGKKRTLMAASFFFGVILLCTGLFGTLLNRAASAFIIMMAGIPLAATLIVPNAMVADVAERDGKESGMRREGMFFGTQGLMQKLVLGFSSLATPLMFSSFGSTAANPLGLQLCGPAAGILVLLSIFFLRRYSLGDGATTPTSSEKVS
jgi:glycoside/pentoside/hexuronide:cation symporter, GPH family